MQRLEEYKNREVYYFWIWILLLSPNLIWCGYSVLICSFLTYWLLNITNQMIELEIAINWRVVALYVLFLDHLESSYLRSDSESYDLNTKIYPVRIWVKFASSHLLTFSLSIYPFRFGLCIWRYPWLIFRFNHLIHQKLNLTNWIWDHPPLTK